MTSLKPLTTQNYQKRQKRDIARCCPAANTATSCPVHKDARTRYYRARYKIRKADRDCYLCFKPLESSETLRACRLCQDRRKERVVKRREAVRTVLSFLPKPDPKVQPQWQLNSYIRRKEQREQARERGLCLKCLKTPTKNNLTLCPPCKEKKNMYARKVYANTTKKLERVAQVLAESGPEVLSLLEEKPKGEDPDPAPSSDADLDNMEVVEALSSLRRSSRLDEKPKPNYYDI